MTLSPVVGVNRSLWEIPGHSCGCAGASSSSPWLITAPSRLNKDEMSYDDEFPPYTIDSGKHSHSEMDAKFYARMHAAIEEGGKCADWYNHRARDQKSQIRPNKANSSVLSGLTFLILSAQGVDM
jgi:hypothetical protein